MKEFQVLSKKNLQGLSTILIIDNYLELIVVLQMFYMSQMHAQWNNLSTYFLVKNKELIPVVNFDQRECDNNVDAVANFSTS